LEKNSTISIFEHGQLVAGNVYSGVMFKESHVDLLARYHSSNPECAFFVPSYKRILFKNYVGVIKVGHITIEVLPKTDRHTENTDVWQKVLLQMLAISLNVEAKASTTANINIRHCNVLETYLQIFLDEVNKLCREGLVRRYRINTGNQNALRGKLLVHRNIIENVVHAERFVVAHPIYDRNNIYHAIIGDCLKCIMRMDVAPEITSQCDSLLLYFPEYKALQITDASFNKLQYDRNTERYRTALIFARMILLNYHPDLRSGASNILAIMFDMNLLWQNYIKFRLKQAAVKLSNENIKVKPSLVKKYWRHESGWSMRLKPDIVLSKNGENIVIDTKWKYKSGVSMEDVRQMYAYGDYFRADQCYLMYPEKLQGSSISRQRGNFYDFSGEGESKLRKSCGLLFVDIIKDHDLYSGIGSEILGVL